MSNHLLPTPTGIDYQIQKLQNYLYERLYNMWGTSGLTASLFEMYGRVYRNESKDGFVPQWYSGGNEYMLDMFYNDKIAAHIFFGVNDPVAVDNNRHEYNVSLYVCCNLDLLYPGVTTQRLDEQVKYDVERLISDGNRFGFKVVQIIGDIDNVLSKYSGKKKKDALSTNLQSHLYFRLDMKVAIDITTVQLCVSQNAIPTNFYAMTGAIQIWFKTNPDTSIMQTLVNGTKIQLEYPTGTSVTLPHLIGRYVFPDIILNGTNFTTIENDTNWMPYDMTTGTFTYDQGSRDGDIMTIMCNENS